MANAYRDENDVPTLIGASNADGETPVRIYADPTTHRLLVDSAGSGGTGTWYTVSGTINGSNTDFTIPVSPSSDIILVLARQVQIETTDYTVSGSTITYTSAPDASLSGQPHVAFVIS